MPRKVAVSVLIWSCGCWWIIASQPNQHALTDVNPWAGSGGAACFTRNCVRAMNLRMWVDRPLRRRGDEVHRLIVRRSARSTSSRAGADIRLVSNAEAPGAGKEKLPQPGPNIQTNRFSSFQLATNDCVVFVGGTTTVGDAKHAFLESFLTRRYPGFNLRFRNLGWEADTVFQQERPLNFPGLVQSVKDQGATVIFANFSLMESARGTEGLAEFTQAYGALLDQLSKVTPRIVLLSPWRYESMRTPVQDTAQKNKNLEAYVRATRTLAERKGMIFVDLFKLQNRPSTSNDTAPLTLDGLHPSAYGYWRAAHEIERDLGFPQPDWGVEIDARARTYQANGTALTEVQISTSTIRFESLDEWLPGHLFHRSDGSVSVWGSRTLKISGLLPGRYVLKIDGVPLYYESQLFWERGKVFTHGPEFEQADRLRDLIVQKNRDFFNFWRPQNWAFLNGDLVSQPSSHRHDDFGARWFPGEMQGFLRLIQEKEAKINKLAKPTVHVYELRRVE